MQRRIHLLIWCLALGIFAFILLDFWNRQTAPLYKKFESAWSEDVQRLEASKKLPEAWFQVKTLDIEGGTPETRKWLRLIHIPLTARKNGKYKLEVLAVAWEEQGTHGVLLQYNLDDLKTKNDIWELGRTLILSRPKPPKIWKSLLRELE